MQVFIEGMFKVEFYVYIEGILELELSFVFVEKNGIELFFDSFEVLIVVYDFYDFFFFLIIYYVGMSVLIDEFDFYKFIWDYLEKVVLQNVVYIEIFFDF